MSKRFILMVGLFLVVCFPALAMQAHGELLSAPEEKDFSEIASLLDPEERQLMARFVQISRFSDLHRSDEASSAQDWYLLEDIAKSAFQKFRMLKLNQGPDDPKTVSARGRFGRVRTWSSSVRDRARGKPDNCPTWSQELLEDEETGNLPLFGYLDRLESVLRTGRKVEEAELGLRFKPTCNNSLELKVGGEEFWPALFSDVEKAQKSVHLQVFGWQADPWGQEIAALLSRKAKEGVEVRLVIDLFGARMMPAVKLANAIKKPEYLLNGNGEEIMFSEMRKAGVEVLFYSRYGRVWEEGTGEKALDLYHWDHRKYVIIDGKIGYCGGYTFEKHMKTEMHDMMVRCRGDVVKQMQASFILNFLYNGGRMQTSDFREFVSRYFPTDERAGTAHAALQLNVPRQQHQVTEAYFSAMDKAKDHLFIINPYFTDNRIVARLIAAAKRGVDVRAILPAKPENPVNAANCEYHYQEMVKNGVKVLLFWGEKGLGRLHAKGMCTESIFSVGSCNMDRMALAHNFDQNIETSDAKTLEAFRAHLFERDFHVSKEYQPPKGKLARAKIMTKGKVSELLDPLD